MRYRLRTLMIVLAIGPPLVAWWGWPTLNAWLEAPPPTEAIIELVPDELVFSEPYVCRVQARRTEQAPPVPDESNDD